MVLRSAVTAEAPGRRPRGIVVQRIVPVISIVMLSPPVLLLVLAGVVITSLADVPELKVAHQVSVGVIPLLGAYVLFSLACRFLLARNPGWREPDGGGPGGVYLATRAVLAVLHYAENRLRSIWRVGEFLFAFRLVVPEHWRFHSWGRAGCDVRAPRRSVR